MIWRNGTTKNRHEINYLLYEKPSAGERGERQRPVKLLANLQLSRKSETHYDGSDAIFQGSNGPFFLAGAERNRQNVVD